MHHRVNIIAHAVDEKMHRHLARWAATSRKCIPVVIDDDQVVGLQVGLAHAGGCSQDAARIHAHGEVAIRGRDEARRVQAMSVAHNLFPKFAFVDHGPDL